MSEPHLYYGLEGEPIDRDEYLDLAERKFIVRSEADDGETSPTEDPTRIGSDHIGGRWVSTVWVGTNYQFHRSGPPLVFETMVFGPDGAGDLCERYSTPDQARAGHDRIVAAIKEGRL